MCIYLCTLCKSLPLLLRWYDLPKAQQLDEH